MEYWVIFGILASLMWGTYVFLLNISEKKYNTPAPEAFFAMSLSILGTAIGYFFLVKFETTHLSILGFVFSVTAGVIWSIGMSSIAIALSNPKTNISKLVPLYNTNTLVAFLLGVLLLGEITHNLPMVLVGAILITSGGVLVTRKESFKKKSQSKSYKNTNDLSKNPVKRVFKTENWIVYGVIASLAWGAYTVPQKLALNYYGFGPAGTLLGVAFGVLIVASCLFFSREKGINLSLDRGTSVAFLSGILWAGGTVAIIHALSLQADIARLVPLYNTNTLVATFLGIVALKEVPKQRLTVVLGAVLIVIGGSIVSIF